MTEDPRVGTQIAGYQIESVIGRGGMSVVYLAEHARLGRKAAVKVLASNLALDESFRERFVGESRAAAALDHPNVIPIYEAGESGDLLYIAMRYVRGTDLRELIDSEGALPPERAVAICAQAAAALDAAHAEGLIHRDVKPGNILLATGTGPGSPEHVYLSDFGVTKRMTSGTGLTGTGQFIGTLDYAAPEQIEGKALDARTDVYSLGCVLYECLTGRPPFPRDAEMAVLWAHMTQAPPMVTDVRPELPPGIDSVVATAMAKSPGERYRSCGELVEAARTALRIDLIPAPSPEAPSVPSPATPGRPTPRRAPFRRGRLVPLAAIVVVGLVLVAVPLLTRGDGGSPGGTAGGPGAASTGWLVRIDRLTGLVSERMAAGTGPMQVAVGEGSTWVADQGSGKVTRFDQEGTRLATIPVHKGLADLAVGLGSVWVANRANGRVYRIDPDTNRVSREIPVGIGVEHVAVGVGSVWVANTRDSSVARIDPERNSATVVKRFGAGRPAVAVASDLIAVVIWRQEGGGVVIDFAFVDPRAGTTTVAGVVNSSSGIGSPPSTLTLAGDSAWVTASLDNTVRRVDFGDPQQQTSIPTGRTPVAIAADGAGFVWVANRGDQTVWKISTDTGQAVSTIRLPGTPTSIAAGNGGIWVTLFPSEA
jgi:YVTN family beta-propeller protein